MPKIKPNVFDGQTIDANEFLTTHWQSMPYLFSKTKLDLSCLPNIEQLFDLAKIENVQSRIVFSEDDIRYQAIYDEPEAWDELTQQKPTLLVSDIEKWHPQAMQLMQWFPFIKSWRFDDLMMSYAPKGSSVGAHTDHYDVFLVQVQGTRKWSFDQQPLVECQMVQDSELSVIKGYKPQKSVELNPGDILYLPPEIPHHGISTSDDCVTCSIGLRAPSKAELLSAVMEQASQNMADSERFKDAVSNNISDASVGQHEIDYLRKQLQDLVDLNDEQLANHFGQFVTGYRLFDDIPFDDNSDCDNRNHWKKSPFAVFAYHATSDTTANLFVNGETIACQLQAAQIICNQDQIKLSDFKPQIENQNLTSPRRLINHLVDIHQALIPIK